jgi:hypothetical protein
VGVGGFSVIVVVWWVVSGFMVVLTISDLGVLILVGVELSCGGVGGMMVVEQLEGGMRMGEGVMGGSARLRRSSSPM